MITRQMFIKVDLLHLLLILSEADPSLVAAKQYMVRDKSLTTIAKGQVYID